MGPMAAKKSAKVKLPPAWPRVDVEPLFNSKEARARFFAAMQDLQDSGIVERVMRLVRAEHGVWLREGERWPRMIWEIADREFGLAFVERDLVEACQTATWSGLRAESREMMERNALLVADDLMDKVFEARRDVNSRRVEMLAGLSPPSEELTSLRASSGLEVAGNLAWCIRQAVAGKDPEPFALYAVSARAKKAMRKQVDRDRPGSPHDLLPDDAAILEACAEKPRMAKKLDAASMRDGEKLSVSHCNKRKKDLKKWGLLTGSRQFEISELGRELLRLRKLAGYHAAIAT